MEILLAFVKNEDLLITERACLASAKFLLEALSGPRGSFLVGRADTIEEITTHRRRDEIGRCCPGRVVQRPCCRVCPG